MKLVVLEPRSVDSMDNKPEAVLDSINRAMKSFKPESYSEVAKYLGNETKKAIKLNEKWEKEAQPNVKMGGASNG